METLLGQTTEELARKHDPLQDGKGQIAALSSDAADQAAELDGRVEELKSEARRLCDDNRIDERALKKIESVGCGGDGEAGLDL